MEQTSSSLLKEQKNSSLLKELDEQERLIKKFEDDPVFFIEIFLDRKLSPKQKIFLDLTKTQKHILAIWSRQTGKSTVIASYIIWRLLYGKGTTVNEEHINEQIAIVAPIKEQHLNLYKKIKSLVDKSDFIAQFITKLNSETILIKNGNEARFFSASPGSQIRGYTATCIVIDESQDVTDEKYSADILPFGATTNALIIEAGTPKTKNHFYLATQNKSIAIVKQPWFECPFLSEEYVMSQRNISPESLWRQEYLCEFVEEGVLAFPSWLFEPEKKAEKLTGRWNLGDYSFMNKIEDLTKELVDFWNKLILEGAAFVMGIDIGKQNDNTVISIWRTDIRPMISPGIIKLPLAMPYQEMARIIGMIYKVFQPWEVNLDYTNEKGFIEMLMNENVAIVKDEKMQRGAIQFSNKNKNEMVTNTRVLLEQFQIQLPKQADNLIHEFLNQQFETNSMGMKQFFHPSNENDDSLWATLLAFKNISVMSREDVVSFVNPWDKFTEKTGTTKEDKAVILANNKFFRSERKYRPADSRRGMRSAFYD